jgi:hypothetical protein
MATQGCTPAPPRPSGATSNWTSTVHGNCFSNIQRLGKWTGGANTKVPNGTDPSPYIEAVGPGSLRPSVASSIYVVIHGWAPGYREVVKRHGGNLLWWDKDAHANGAWTSDWAWSPYTAVGLFDSLKVNETGMLQSIKAIDSKAAVLAYSWLDDSATDSWTYDEAYESEAYAHANGIRLANALSEAIDGIAFWNGSLHLIGHSHGAKVATVAALALQHRGCPVVGLTLLDSPEHNLVRVNNAANFLGFYLDELNIAEPSLEGESGAFVDNYASYFGVAYAGSKNLKNIVEVGLDPQEVITPLDVANFHIYAAAWYGGAAAGAKSVGQPGLGLDWPPPRQPFKPALNQNWPDGISQLSQWKLQAGSFIHDTFSFTTRPMTVKTIAMKGNVRGNPSDGLLFTSSGPYPTYSIFEGSYDNPDDSHHFGIAFDLVWTAPQVGDYLVVTMEPVVVGDDLVLLVIDGQSNPGGRTSVAINSDAPGHALSLRIYFLGSPATNALVKVLAISNFRFVDIDSVNSDLSAQRSEYIRKAREENSRKVRGVSAARPEASDVGAT